MSKLCNLALEGDFAGAREVHRRYHSLMEVNFVESNPGPVKAAMTMLGLLEPHYRLPMVEPESGSQTKIARVLAQAGLTTPAAASAD